MRTTYIILVALVASAFVYNCSNRNNGIKLKTTENEEFFNDSKQQETNTSSNSDIFSDLLRLTQNLNQFEGYAFVGELNGPCYMVITKNSQGNNIAVIRYAIIDYYSGKVDNVDETYTITDLKGKSAKVEDYGVKNTSNYANSYLYGQVKGLKGSTNYGKIRDYSATGIIKIFLDTVDYKIKYVISSEESNWSYQGATKLVTEQYVKLKEFFDNLKIPEIVSNDSGQELEPEYRGLVYNFIVNVIMGNKAAIAKMISYPFGRESPIPIIKNEQEFLTRFDEIFDDSLKQMIIRSNPVKDWDAWGWRGIFFHQGEIRIDYDGRLMDIHYESKYEKKLKDKLIAQEKGRIHPSLSNFYKPMYVLETSEFRIRIDDLGNDKYRYASWPLNKSMREKPDIVLDNGQREPGLDDIFLFKNLDYIYECNIYYFGDDGIPPASVKIDKGEKTILNQDAVIMINYKIN